jgi:hypothetical protein
MIKNILYILILCGFAACNTPKEQVNTILSVSKVAMAKDNNGKIALELQKIPANDQTFHCVVEMNKKQAGAKVKVTLIAVSAEGYENFEVRTLEQDTDSINTKLDFPFSLARTWFKGKYKCDVYLNDSLAQVKDFVIE